MKTKTNERLALFWNIAIVLLTVWGCIVMARFDHGKGLLTARGWENLKFFTVLSNVFEGLVSLALAICLGRGRRGRAADVPRSLFLLKFLAGVTVTLTFLVGYRHLYRDANFWFHLVIPLAAILEFILLDRFDRVSFRETLLAPLPALAYGIVYTANVVVNGPGKFPAANDFYGFTHWGLPVGFAIFALILLMSWGAGCFLRWGNGLGRDHETSE